MARAAVKAGSTSDLMMPGKPAPRAPDRQHVQVYGEYLDKQDAEPKRGEGKADNGQTPDHVVSHAVLARRCQRRHGQSDSDRKDGGHRDKGGRLADPAPDERRRRNMVDVGLPEVALEELAQELAQLRGQRTVQAPLTSEGGNGRGRSAYPEHGARRVARLHVHEQESGEGDAKNDEHR